MSTYRIIQKMVICFATDDVFYSLQTLRPSAAQTAHSNPTEVSTQRKEIPHRAAKIAEIFLPQNPQER
jgi:hypothetical protein